MRNVTNQILKAWFELLDQNISVPVYRTDAPPNETGNYVLLRVESETDKTNNSRWVTQPVIITEIVCRFGIRIDDSVAPGIDDEIAQLLFSAPGANSLPVQSNIFITDVRRQNATYINEDDGTFRIHRLITRNLHRVQQLVTT